MAKKKELEEVTIEEEVTPEKEVLWAKKVWTETELAIMPLDEQRKVIADIKAGKASIKID